MRSLPTVAHAPPVKRGDLTAVDEYEVIVILDGEFGQHDSVSPKEILAVLEKGKTVIGAASMGALRASELDRCGMIGRLGLRLFPAAVRSPRCRCRAHLFDLRLQADDGADGRHRILDGEGAAAAGSIDRRGRTLVLKTARNFFFADRTADRLMGALRFAIGDQVLRLLLALSGGSIPSIKTLDAEKAIRRAASLSAKAGC